jgi:hypothetical protein
MGVQVSRCARWPRGLAVPRVWVRFFPEFGGVDLLGFGVLLDDGDAGDPAAYVHVYVPWPRPRPHEVDVELPRPSWQRQAFQWRRPRVEA